MFLGALREFRHQGLYHDVIDAFARLCHRLDRFGLVHLNADNAFCIGVQLQHNLKAAHDALRFFQHQTVVAGQVRLAFCRVDEDMVDGRILGRVQLYMRREARAAKADNACVFDCCKNFVIGHCRVVPAFVQAFDFFHLAIVLHNDGFYHRTAGNQHRADVHHFAGNTGKNGRGHERAGFGDFLSYLHMVTNSHQRIAGRADVLAHGIEQFRIFLWEYHLDGLVSRKGFPIGRMHSAFEC